MKDYIYPEEFKDRAITRLLNRLLIDEVKNMPIKEETAASILEPVQPMQCDFSEAEARCAAYYTEMAEQGRDLHMERAEREGITRQEAKRRNFMEIYGGNHLRTGYEQLPPGGYIVPADKFRPMTNFRKELAAVEKKITLNKQVPREQLPLPFPPKSDGTEF